MKRFTALMFALCMTLCLATPAMAADITPNSEQQAGTMEVSYTTTESYTVTIPADVIVTTAGVNADLTAKNLLLASGHTLKVTAESTNGYKLKAGDSAIAYTCTVGDKTLSSTEKTVLTVSAGTIEDQTATMTFKTTTDAINAATLAGKHTDKLTFTCSVESAG